MLELDFRSIGSTSEVSTLTIMNKILFTSSLHILPYGLVLNKPSNICLTENNILRCVSNTDAINTIILKLYSQYNFVDKFISDLGQVCGCPGVL